jgi:hypothetical protein
MSSSILLSFLQMTFHVPQICATVHKKGKSIWRDTNDENTIFPEMHPSIHGEHNVRNI